MRMLRLLLVFALATSFKEEVRVQGAKSGTQARTEVVSSSSSSSSSNGDIDLTLRLARPSIVEQQVNLAGLQPQHPHRPDGNPLVVQEFNQASSSASTRSPHRSTAEGKRHASEHPLRSSQSRRRPRRSRAQTMFSIADGWAPLSATASSTMPVDDRTAMSMMQLAERIGATPEHPWHSSRSSSLSPPFRQHHAPFPLFTSPTSMQDRQTEAGQVSRPAAAADLSTYARNHPFPLLLPPSSPPSPLQIIPPLASQSHSRPSDEQSFQAKQVGEGEMQQQQVVSGPQHPRPSPLHHPPIQIQQQQRQSSGSLPSRQRTPSPILPKPFFHDHRRPRPHPHHSFGGSGSWPAVPLHPNLHHPRQLGEQRFGHYHHRQQLVVHPPSVRLPTRHRPQTFASSHIWRPMAERHSASSSSSFSANSSSLGYKPWSPRLVGVGPSRPSSLGHDTGTTVVASSRNPLAGPHRTTDLQAAAAAAEAASSSRPASTTTRHTVGPQAYASLPPSGFIHVPHQTPTAPRLSSPVLHGVVRAEPTAEQGKAVPLESVVHSDTATLHHNTPEMLPVLHLDDPQHPPQHQHQHQYQSGPDVQQQQQQQPPIVMTLPVPMPLRAVRPASPSPSLSTIPPTPSRTGPDSWYETFPKLAAARVARRGRPRSAIVHRDHFPHHHHPPPPHHHDASTSGHREVLIWKQASKEGQGSGHHLATPKDASSSPDTTSATKLTDSHRPALLHAGVTTTTTTTTASANAPATILPQQDLQKFDSTFAAVLSHFNAYNVDPSSTWTLPRITLETTADSSAAPLSSKGKLGADDAGSLIHSDRLRHRGSPSSPEIITPAGAVAQVARLLAQPAPLSSSPAERSRTSTPTRTSTGAAATPIEENEEEGGEEGGGEGGATHGFSGKRKRATSVSDSDANKKLRLSKGSSSSREVVYKEAMTSPSALTPLRVGRTDSRLPESSEAEDSEKTISWTYPGSDGHEPGTHTSASAPSANLRSRTRSKSTSISPPDSRSRSRSRSRSSSRSEANSESGWISVDVGGNSSSSSFSSSSSSPRGSFGSSSRSSSTDATHDLDLETGLSSRSTGSALQS